MEDQAKETPPPPYTVHSHGQPSTLPEYVQPTNMALHQPLSTQYGPPPPPYGQLPPPYGQPQYNQPVLHMQYTQPTGSQQVIITQPSLIGVPQYGPNPCSVKCVHCSSEVTTYTSRTCGGTVWMMAGIICLIGLFFPCMWLGFCFIPFCIPSLYDTRHTCPNCQRHLGTFAHHSGGSTSHGNYCAGYAGSTTVSQRH